MPMTRKDALKLLGLEEGTPLERIRPRYKKLALKWHPDKQGNNKAMTKKFQDLTEAYKVLSVGEEEPEDWTEAFADIYEMFKFGTTGPKGHNPKTCTCSHCITGWDNFSSGDEMDGYWYSNDEDEYDRMAEYTRHDYRYADHLLSSMTDKMYINSSSRGKKKTGYKSHQNFNRVSQEEAERNASELIQAEEEEKLKAEKRKLKNKKKKEQKKASKAKKKGKTPKHKVTEEANSSGSETENAPNLTGEHNTTSNKTNNKEDSFTWDTSSAFFKAASKLHSYSQTESSNDGSVVRTDSQPPSPPEELNVNPYTNTIAVEGRVEDYSELQIKESRRIAATANRFAANFQFIEAVTKFTEAINMYPLDHRYYGNRSFCYEHLGEFEKALSDAECSLRILPNWPKGHFRRGKALYGLQKYPEAEEAYLKVLDLDSSYDDAKTELVTTRTSCLVFLGFTEEQCRKVVNGSHSIQSAIDSLLGPSPQKSASNSEFVTVNVPSKVSTNSKEERGDPVANGQVVNGVMNDGRCSVWVGNINRDISEEQLKQLFSRCGEVESVRILSERHCAFVNYLDPHGAARAIEELQGHYYCGQYLLLRYPDNPRDGPFISSKKNKMINDKLHGPVNGDECYFWRTTGCHFGTRCFYKHLPGSRGLDLKDHMTKTE